MIRQLSIKNLAIIDDITIDFDSNLNVLTGETGAGKSIIIDAISLIFGARANNEIIASGKDSAFISVSLELKKEVADIIYEKYDLDLKDECIISRTLVKDGKGSVKINGIITPLYLLNEISRYLIDISNQNESSYLLNHKNHLELLDSYIYKENPTFKDEYKAIYKQYLSLLSKIEELNKTSVNEDEIEFYNFKLNELKDYNYTISDEDNIASEYKRLQSLVKNEAVIEQIVNDLDFDNQGAINKLYSAIRLLSSISNNDKLNEYYEKFNSLYLDLSDLVESFKHDFINDEFDEAKLDELSDKITLINRLKRKYNTNDLLAYKKEINDKLEMLNNKEIELSKLNKELSLVKDKLDIEASKISNIRKEKAISLSNKVKNELNDLYLLDASFVIKVDRIDSFNKDGFDDVEFYMSANKGVSEMPLVKVASGGEVSRIMLGLKSVFTSLTNVDIIIFDEIDTGVSGKVALSMGKKMESISKYSQVLAITHLPQVAAMSDHHYYIYKDVVNNHTQTFVKKLDNESKVLEVARLLSGDTLSNSFIDSAKELISLK